MNQPSFAELVPLLIIAAAFYLLIFRPQRARAQKQRVLVGSLSAGDRIITIGGFHGTVQDVTEDALRLEIAPGTVVTLAKSAIGRKLTEA